MKDLSNFIKDLDSKSVILGSQFGRQYKSLYIKEKINERFYSLYQQDSRDVFFNDPLKFMAVYDSEKNILFNVEHSFGWGMENQDFDIEISSMTFETIKNEISDKIKEDLIRFAIDNEQKLTVEAYESYRDQEEYVFESLRKEAKRYFLTNDCTFLLEDSSLQSQAKIGRRICCDISDSNKSHSWISNQIVIDYLTNKAKTIDNESSIYKTNSQSRKEIGRNILNLQFFSGAIEHFQKNKGDKFNLLHKKKDIISCLEGKNAINLVITIRYGDDSLNFKFSKDRLLMTLKNPEDTGASDFGKSYHEVKEFLKSHKDNCSLWRRDEFDFQNISMISYSGRLLYTDKELVGKGMVKETHQKGIRR